MFYNVPGEWDEYEGGELADNETNHDTVQSTTDSDGDDTEGSESDSN